MSSIFNCIRDRFRRRAQEPVNDLRSITPTIPQAPEREFSLATPKRVAEGVDGKTTEEIVPVTPDEIPRTTSGNIAAVTSEVAPTSLEEISPKNSNELPFFTQHIVEEPLPHVKETEQPASSLVLKSIEGGDSQGPILKEEIEQVPYPSQTNDDPKFPILSKSHPRFEVAVRRPTFPGPLEVPDKDRLERRSRSPTLETPNISRQTSGASSNGSRSRSGSQASSKTEHWLKDQLEEARIEWPEKSHKFFVPRSTQEELITPTNVIQDILARGAEISEEAAEKYANDACRYARQLYATLACLKKGPEICSLLDEQVTDEDLPLVRKPSKKCKFALCRKNGETIKTMENWKNKHLEDFDRIQWWMIAPVFIPRERHKFDANITLPFVPFSENDETKEKKHGAYSKVYPVRIHPAHHEFSTDIQLEGELPLIAVKELFSSEEREFLKEATILEALGPRKHPHLIKLLATFEKDKTYHLLFPYANANLRKYWDDHPTPNFDAATVLWSMKQMTGIASGIVLIHNFRVTHALFLPGSGDTNFRNPGNDELKVETKNEEQWFGRHGDIKPENILWFEKGENYRDAKGVLHAADLKGVLQIADFGLGRVHGRESRSGVNPDHVVSSPTYEPPECKLRQPVSRAYDIWSLGCLYLEFITWLLKGNAEIEGFSDARGRVPTGNDINDDYFYTITTTAFGTKDAEVREGVRTWVEQLHAHPKCSQLIHDLLDLIMGELLVIDSKSRSKAIWLYKQLQIYLAKAEHDNDYLLKAVPISIKKVEDDKITPLELPNGKPKRNSVTFTDQNKPVRPQNHTHPKSQPNIDRSMATKDLLGRRMGTPSSLKKVVPHRTWPERQQTMH